MAGIESGRARTAPLDGWQRAFAFAALALAGVCVAWSVYAMWRYGWRDFYADQWRIYGNLFAWSFPDVPFGLENGHRPVFPNLVRLVELALFGPTQSLQLAFGIVAALVALSILVATIVKDRALDASRRHAAIALSAVGLFWLANARMQMHPTESVHLYLIIAMVGLAAYQLGRAYDARQGHARAAWIGSIAAVVATFSFGSGVALHGAVIAGLVLIRSPWRAVAIAVAMTAVSLVLYFTLPSGGSVQGVMTIAPVDNARVAAQWLANPFVAAVLPYTAPGVANWVPAALHDISFRTAPWYLARFGDITVASQPQLAVGLVGLAVLFVQSVRSWLHGGLGRVATAGLVLAWFGLGTALIVSLSRLGYFLEYPGQIYANRYLPWPCLFWLGLAFTLLRTHARPTARVLAGAAFVAAFALTQHQAWAQWSKNVQSMSRVHAVAVASGAYADEMPRGETVTPEVDFAVPLLRERRYAMFGWPSTARLGEVVPANVRGGEHASAIAMPEYSKVQPAWTLHVPEPITGHAHYVVLDRAGRVIGVARPMPVQSSRKLVTFFERDATRTSVHPIDRDGTVGEGVVIRFD